MRCIGFQRGRYYRYVHGQLSALVGEEEVCRAELVVAGNGLFRAYPDAGERGCIS
jgi:hypothetical protein